ncbi:MAG: threonylcarbamoyl-AMP synthase [Phycisphaerales bacterium]|nr:threonylcarbamoyl-AMP synthase [Phycisphaerales bacterium]
MFGQQSRIDRQIDEATALLARGGLVAFATETVYGLGADATNPLAVARIFEVKARPRFDPLIVHVRSAEQAARCAATWPDAAAQLARRFWPGPLTLVLPRRPGVIPDIVTAGLPTVALRVPDHPLALALLERAGVPVAAPSANRFGAVSPTTADHVRESLGDDVDMVLDGGPCRAGVESTIISLASDAPMLLRPGALALEDIEAIVGPIALPQPAGADSAPLAPGMLARHYATRTPIVFSDAVPTGLVRGRCGRLSFTGADDKTAYGALEVLSPSGDLREAAAGLFAAMRRLDALGFDAIIADHFPHMGLGRAINDRLTRASVR